ncbi:MAG: hypothetical protein TREMPRED_000313 [Tremellales sp. Tagirdzhanova-0007]|nr:MAG: hypothetical protein TREMPRED_000313 [Tremellales sp. Tagirdzhanova-0007]
MPTLRNLILLASFALSSVVSAKSDFGGPCAQADSHLDQGTTWALDTDCNPTYYCAANGTCAHKGCRKDVYPYGYSDTSYADLPPLCPQGQFCPDEADGCLYQVPVGGQCQKDRDDECRPPPNAGQLAGYLNVNGSICLNYECYWSNVTVGQTCINDNTPYTAFTASGGQYAFVVSRDDCANGLFCDGTSLQCLLTKEIGGACSGNKECLSYNCESSGRCGAAADVPLHPRSYVYILVGLGILGLILGVMVALWFTHRRSRKENHIRLEQYYNEQIAYRHSIMSMSHARKTLLSSPTQGDMGQQSVMSDDGYGYTPGTGGSGLSIPNLRRDSSAAWSDTADSEILLIGDNHGQSSRRFGR